MRISDWSSDVCSSDLAEVDYFHPDLEPVLQSTYGVIVYQEQVMLISQIIGGYTLGGADLLRRAMGKKKAEEMAKHRAIFEKGAVRSEERRVGKGWVSTCRSGWSP